MIKLQSPTAKVMAVLLILLPIRFTIYFLSLRAGVPHTNLIELLSEIFVVVAGGYLVVTNGSTIWQKLKSPRKWPTIIKLAITLMAWSLVTLSYTPAGLGQALRGLRLDFLGLGILVLLWLVPVEKKEQEPIFEIAYWGCVFIAVIGLIELAFGPKFLHVLGFVPFEFFAGKIRQVHSLLPTPNMFGSAMVLLTALLYKRNPNPSWWMVALLGVLVGSSYSRSAWLALAILGGCIFFYKLKRGVFAWSIGVLALGLALGIFLGISRYHGTVKSAATHDASTAQHQKASSRAFDELIHVNQHWLMGGGIGSAGPATLNGPQPPQIAESWYLQIFEEFGVIGLILFLALIFFVIKELFSKNETIMGFLAIALSVNALFLHIWADDRFVHIMFWVLVGVALYSSVRKKDKPATT